MTKEEMRLMIVYIRTCPRPVLDFVSALVDSEIESRTDAEDEAARPGGTGSGGVQKVPEETALEKPEARKPRQKKAGLTREQEETVRSQYQAGVKVKEIAKRLKVETYVIYKITKDFKRPADSVLDGKSDDLVRVRQFRCEDAVDCGLLFKKNTDEHTASCPKCGMTAMEIK